MTARILFILVTVLAGIVSCTDKQSESTPPRKAQTNSETTRPLRIPSIVEEPEAPPGLPIFIDLAQTSLPSFWLKSSALRDSFKSITNIQHEQRVDQQRPDGSRFISITWRAPLKLVEKQRILASLKLKMSKHENDESWHIKGNRAWRFKEDKADESIALEWRRQSTFTDKSKRRCGRPHHIDSPPKLPNMIRTVMTKTTTRRTISVSDQITRSQHEISLTIWYKNGFAQDEHIGKIQAHLNAADWAKEDGNSVKQSWSNRDRERLSWYPVREAFPMGCSLRGPLVRFTWSQDR